MLFVNAAMVTYFGLFSWVAGDLDHVQEVIFNMLVRNLSQRVPMCFKCLVFSLS